MKKFFFLLFLFFSIAARISQAAESKEPHPIPGPEVPSASDFAEGNLKPQLEKAVPQESSSGRHASEDAGEEKTPL